MSEIKWVKPSASQLAQGILALRPITCYCDNGSADTPRLDRVAYFGGYVDKDTKWFIERRPAVIEYTYPMLLKFWRKHPDLMPRFIDVILPT